MNLSRYGKGFKILVIIGLICGLLFFGLGIPLLGQTLVEELGSELSYLYYPWLILIETCAIPCFIVLFICWKIAHNISKHEIFIHDNSQYFHLIATLALVDTIFFFTMNIIYLIFNCNHPSILIISLGISFIGIAFTYCIHALAQYMAVSTSLKEDNDLTI